MSAETMTPTERMEAAYHLEKPDRVPVVMNVDEKFAGRYMGLTQAEVTHNFEAGTKAIRDTFDAFGEWDALAEHFPLAEWYLVDAEMPMKFKTPGRELPEDYILQPVEFEAITRDDYDTIIEMGWPSFVNEILCERSRGVTAEEAAKAKKTFKERVSKITEYWHQRGVFFLSGPIIRHPFHHLSCARSITHFTMDLFEIPEKVMRVMDVLVDTAIENGIYGTKEKKHWVVRVIEERASNYYMSLEMFEKFWMPWAHKMVDAFIAEGFNILFHLDSDFTNNLKYFKEFPKGRVIIETDGMTNLLKAKEILGGHTCIKGDVPAAMLVCGNPAEVTEYCKKLVDELGKDGGFILSNGCTIPVDTKPENFQAVLDIARYYSLNI